MLAAIRRATALGSVGYQGKRWGNRQFIIDRVAALRLPAIYPWVEDGEEEGGFLAYGPRIVQIFRELLAQQLVKLLRVQA